MTEKAKVVIECGGRERSYEVSPGETLVVETAYRASVRFRPAKGPQPMHLRHGWPYRYDKDRERYQYQRENSGPWQDISFGAVGCLDADYLRFLADLKAATIKWAAS